MADNIFSIVPVEVLADDRLTPSHIRVLIALLSFRTRNTDTVWPSREALSARLGGMHITNVSKATSELCELGWLEKVGSGGLSRSVRYRVVVPDLSEPQEQPKKLSTTVAKLTTVANSATVAKVATTPPSTVAKVATPTVAKVATRKEETIEETIEETTKGNRQSARALLAKRGLPGDLAVAWMRVRREKRLAITEPALDALQREADKAGLTFEQAIRICCENGWAGFKAHWPRDGGLNAKAQQGAPPWWSSDEGIMAKGREVKLLPRPGEPMSGYKARINERLSQPT